MESFINYFDVANMPWLLLGALTYALLKLSALVGREQKFSFGKWAKDNMIKQGISLIIAMIVMIVAEQFPEILKVIGFTSMTGFVAFMLGFLSDVVVKNLWKMRKARETTDAPLE